jgi:hypothetical protein
VTTVQAGTVSAPAITTTGDTNTGIFFPAADTIAFAEGGAEAMRIDSAGNVGIGTSSPAANTKVTIQNSATVSAGFDLKNSSGTTTALIKLAGAAAGFTTIVVSIWILGGFTALTVSTIALYVGSIFDEAKNRPHSIVKEITRS